MKIQVALDFVTIEEGIEIIREIEREIDIVEIGTPMIYRYGVIAVSKIKQSFPSLEVLFDGKIVDAGAEEAGMAFETGADYVTVLATSHDATIAGVVEKAGKFGKKVVIDLIGCDDIAERSKKLMELGVDYIAIHIGVDIQNEDRSFDHEFKILEPVVDSKKLAVAGGINPEIAKSIAKYKPGIVIVGNAVNKAKDKKQLILDIRESLKVI